MPWYSWDDDVGETGAEEAPEPLMIAGPVTAISRRGDIGTTWWGRQWVSAMLALGDTRLDRGKGYARSGAVRDLTIQHGIAFAQVQGSAYRPYKTSVGLRVFSGAEWAQALDALAGEAIYAAKLLSGEMPGGIEDVFQSVGLSLFPRSRADIDFDCTCPDWGDPCKHAAAIYYLLAEQLDTDPFILFHLRGMTREQVLDGLRLRRGGGTDGQIDEPLREAAPPLDADMEKFWTDELSRLPHSIPVVPSRSPMLAQLGAPPGGVERELRRIYQVVSEVAAGRLVEEVVEKDEHDDI